MAVDRVFGAVAGAGPRVEEKAVAPALDLEATPVSSPLPPCPYRGLFAFREEDAPFFFGRETFTDRLVDALEERERSLVAVIGPFVRRSVPPILCS